MKAITLWQPWASLLACGVIEYETRSWATKYRGPMAIHAAASEPKHLLYQMSGIITSILGTDNPPDYPRGAVIATANLIACHEMKEDSFGNIGFWRSNNGIWEFYAISEQQASLGDWQPSGFGIGVNRMHNHLRQVFQICFPFHKLSPYYINKL